MSEVQAQTGRRLPPVHVVSVVSMVLVIAGGIFMASYLPGRPPLGPAVALLAVSGALLVGNVIVLARVREFAWGTYIRVGGWVLLAYAVIAGMLEFVFVFDHTRGAVLVVLSLMLLVFAVDIPIVLAFSVARYQEPPGGSSTGVIPPPPPSGR
jgi:hypothetical protein